MVEVAAARFRKQGLDKVGVATLMGGCWGSIGLTPVAASGTQVRSIWNFNMRSRAK